MKKEEKKEVVRKKFKFTKFLIVLLVLYLFGFFIYSIIISPIKNIYISGNDYLSDQEIIDTSGLKNYPSYFLTSKNSIKKKLLKNNLIKEVKINKKLIGQVYINVTETKPLFYYSNTKKTVLEDGNTIEDNKYIIPTLINTVDNEMLDKLIDKYSDVKEEIRLMISEMKYVPNDIDKERFILMMNDGNYVYITLYKFSSINDYTKILQTLENKKGILYLDSGNYFEIFKEE